VHKSNACFLEAMHEYADFLEIYPELFWRPLFELGDPFRNHFPCCFRADEDVHPDFYLRVAVTTPKCDPANDAVKNPAKCGAAFAAKLKAESMVTFVGCQQVFTS
jgi:hypothetical protein